MDAIAVAPASQAETDILAAKCRLLEDQVADLRRQVRALRADLAYVAGYAGADLTKFRGILRPIPIEPKPTLVELQTDLIAAVAAGGS